MRFDQLLDQFECGSIGAVYHLTQYLLIGKVVVIVVVATDIEEWVVLEPKRLV